jgi:hypothetical protein
VRSRIAYCACAFVGEAGGKAIASRLLGLPVVRCFDAGERAAGEHRHAHQQGDGLSSISSPDVLASVGCENFRRLIIV